MALKTTTFTVLVTVTHDANQHVYGSRVSGQLQKALEEGDAQNPGLASAMCNTWVGDKFSRTTTNIDAIRKVHADIRHAAEQGL